MSVLALNAEPSFSEQQKASDRSSKDIGPIRRLVVAYFDVIAANRLFSPL
jgi:hypothetical protein